MLSYFEAVKRVKIVADLGGLLESGMSIIKTPDALFRVRCGKGHPFLTTLNILAEKTKETYCEDCIYKPPPVLPISMLNTPLRIRREVSPTPRNSVELKAEINPFPKVEPLVLSTSPESTLTAQIKELLVDVKENPEMFKDMVEDPVERPVDNVRADFQEPKPKRIKKRLPAVVKSPKKKAPICGSKFVVLKTSDFIVPDASKKRSGKPRAKKIHGRSL